MKNIEIASPPQWWTFSTSFLKMKFYNRFLDSAAVGMTLFNND